jgi:hypothetical protein
VATVALTGVVGKKLIGDFESSANRLLQDAGQQGDIMEAMLGNELRVATQNMSLAMADQQDKFFQELSPQLQSAFQLMNGLIEQVNATTGRAQSIAEAANIDLIDFTNRLPFTSKVDYYLSSVKGLTQVHTDTDYQILVRGLGFGFDPPGRSHTLTVLVNGKPLGAPLVTRTSDIEERVVVPHDLLEPLFSDDTVSTVQLKLVDDLTFKRHFLGVMPYDDVSQQATELALVLMPRYAGTVAGVETKQVSQMDPAIHTASLQHVTNNCHPDQPCDWNQQWTGANDEVATNVRYACEGQCGWDYALHRAVVDRTHNSYAPDYDVLNDGHTVVVYRHNDGEHSTSVTHYIDYRKMVKMAQESPLVPVKVAFNKPFTLLLDPSNTECQYALTGKLVTKQTPYVDSGSRGSSADKLLVVQSVARVGNQCRVTLSVNIP